MRPVTSPHATSSILIITILLIAGPAIVHAQPVPAGSEFQVNAYTTEEQFFPSVSVDGLGSFVIVWNSGPSF